ncbi:MAG: serine hydrolase [Actinomycetales bacterium]|uniref:Serine hydrolase n=1 Tax=Candidatus Phosphoribacter hodrii TaxID=2953743 RepID=A0A934X6K1_9MICO|nr:serine hydrolase [Candidatus Phosphoribacter hodrii]
MSRSPRIDDLFDVVRPQEPALSPDGRVAAYVRASVDREQDRPVSEVWSVATAGGEPTRLTSGPADSAPSWSPDGSRLAFVRAADGPGQLWLLPTAGGEPSRLTSLTWGAGAAVWSPDGTQIAFSAPVAPAGRTPAEHASAPIATTDLNYQADGAGFLGGLRQQIHVVDVASGTVRQLTWCAGHAAEPVWSRDGSQVYFTTTVGDDADLTMSMGPHVVDVASPGSARALPASAMELEVSVAVHPSTGELLCIGNADPGIGHTRAWLRGVDSTDITELAADLDRNVMTGAPGYPGAPLTYVADDTLLMCIRDRGYVNLLRLDADGSRRTLVGGAQTVSGLSVSSDGRQAVVVVSSPESFGELARLDLADGTLTALTAYGTGVLSELDWTVPRERTFTAPDGRPVHGWILRGEDVDGATPLLLDIHGGPHNAWSGAADAEHLYHQVLAAAGWTVLLLNPRGSDGYGEDFMTAALGHWGTADADDFLTPIDDLVAQGLVDPARLAVTGYSYGGYMTCYLTSRDGRFAAAVPGGVVADSHSVATTSDMGLLLAVKEMGGLPWTDRERFDEMSPMHLIDQVQTPTLVLQGAADVRCPVSEAQRWFTALRTRGVPSELVLYPGASHLFILNGRPSHRADWNRRIVDWVHRYAGSPASPDGARPRVRPVVDAAHWQHRLTELIARHEVPGATLGILRLGAAPGGGDEVVAAAAGVLNQRTGAPVSADSVFQIGSITKVWTATLAMQLVEQGALDLDAPVRDVLPELRLGDESVAARVTVRHLLTHTSGIDGDIFTDTGRGDDVLAKYVEVLADARQLHPLGETFSYCNSGFGLLGRVIEKVTGQVWDTVLRERIITPLGLTRTGTLPEEALLWDAALGHERGDDGVLRPASQWGIPRSSGPAGLITAPVRDLLEFAAMHLRGGVGSAGGGARVLGEAAVAAMQREQVRLPGAFDLGDSWGLGWIRFGWGDDRLIGHDGNTIGQSAFLRILPRDGLIVALLTNGGNTPDLFRSLYGEVFAALADVTLPPVLAPTGVSVDLTDAAGTYERDAERIVIGTVDGIPTLTSTALHPLTADSDPTQAYELHGFDERTALVRPPAMDTWSAVTFYRTASGTRYVHNHLRATPEVAPRPSDAAPGQ